MGLDLDTINQLLNEDNKHKDGIQRVIQLGPLRLHDQEMTCASSGCTSSTYVKVNGIPCCTIHALYELNKMVMLNRELRIDDCTCKSGRSTRLHTHTADCPVWERYK